jgi:histidinol dehydrogenase
MAQLQIQRLNDLTAKEIKKIQSREAIDVSEIHAELIAPMAEYFIKDSKEAFLEYAKKFDFIPDSIVLNSAELSDTFEKYNRENPKVVESFSHAHKNIKTFHEKQKPNDLECNIAGNTLGLKFQPFDKVALYVPGGKALYPSTVLMGVTPAVIAGVKDITILSPPDPDTGRVNPVIEAMAHLAGATRVLQAGGAQSIMAATFGIPNLEVPKADFIYGPGNKYVAAAKSFIFGKNLAGIDSFAGPSEVCIIADELANPHYLAHDLLAQAEHDEDASAILLCNSREVCEKTLIELEQAISVRGSRSQITKTAIEKNGKILLVNDIDEAISFSNEYAPEHLEIQTANCKNDLQKITAAGSIFLGSFSPVAVGDYFSGTNHILPTGGACRFASGVSVNSFFRRITYQHCTEKGLLNSALPISTMSKIEGLFDEHGYSVLARFPELNINE